MLVIKKDVLKIIILVILFSLTLSFIWINSLVGSDVSNGFSYSIVDRIIHILPSGFVIERDILFFLLRKAAHICEYFVLGAEIAIVKVMYPKIQVLSCMFLVLAAATADETIQMFSGRSSMVTDILIDFTGAVFGMMTIALIKKLFSKRKKCAE